VLLQDVQRALAYGCRFAVIRQQGGELGGERGNIADANDSMRSEQLTDQGFEVFHVRADDDGLCREDGFGGVLSAGGEETFANDDGIGVCRPVSQFSRAVDKQNIHGFVVARDALTAQANHEALRLQCVPHFQASFCMTRHAEEEAARIAESRGEQ
jgi:hypothetical protein